MNMNGNTNGNAGGGESEQAPAPQPLHLGLHGDPDGFTFVVGEQEVRLPWVVIGTLVQGMVGLGRQHGIPRGAFIRALIGDFNGEHPGEEYRLCRWDGATWQPVMQDGITPDAQAAKTQIWRPGQDQSGLFPRRG